MEYKFIPSVRKEFIILRDYFISNDNVQGIYFLLFDESENKLLTRFLSVKDISNDEIWKKKSFFNHTYYSIIVDKGPGKENKVVFEKGILRIRRTNIFDEISEQRKSAERVIFYLAPSVFKPF